MSINLLMIAYRRSHVTAVVLALVALSLWPVGVAHAATVCPAPAVCDFTTVQAAIDGSMDFEIDIEVGTFVEQITINRDLTLTGKHSSLTTLLFGGNSVVTVNSGVTATIQALTIRGGMAQDGGGIFNSGTLTVQDAVVTSNTAVGHGGGIYTEADLTLKNVDISDNILIGPNLPDGTGGGLYIKNAPGGTDVTIIDSTISGHIANRGGGIYQNAGTLTLVRSRVVNNLAEQLDSTGPVVIANGGGIYVVNGGTLTTTASTISDNATDGPTTGNESGGGITIVQSTAILGRTTISGNTSVLGGGIANDQGSTLTLNLSTLSGNHAAFHGGGLWNDNNSTAYINRSTITANDAVLSGAGVSNDPVIGSGSSVTFQNSIVASQTFGADCAGTANFTSNNHNIESGTFCAFNQSNDQQNTDPLLTSLVDYGGPTETHNLNDGSPAIDRGNPFGCRVDRDGDGAVETLFLGDQRGIFRVDVPNIGSSLPFDVCDVGAVEYNLILNGGLEDDKDGDGFPDYWQGTNFRPNDRYICRPNFAHFGRCAMRIRGRNNTTKEILQVIDRPGGQFFGQPYELVVFSASMNAAANSLKIVVGFENLPGLAIIETPPFDIATGTHPYQRFASSVVAPIFHNKIYVYAIRSTMTPAGGVLIDDVSLVPE